MTQTPPVGIVIVSYKGLADTQECLRSLKGLRYPNYFTVVVDQDSGDGTPDAVRGEFPDVVMVENPRNDGFAGGNNRGVRVAIEQGAEYVFLLNNDTTVAPDLLEPLIGQMLADPKIGIVGPLMLYFDTPTMVWSAGGKMDGRGQSILMGEGTDAGSVDPAPRDVDFIVGCGLLARRAVWDEAGGLDERYFIYYEESDLCAGAKRQGWRVVLVPESRLWHKVSRTFGPGSDFTLYYMRRNVLMYLRRNSPRPRQAVAAAFLDSLRLAAVWTVQGKRGRAGVLLRALGDFARGRMGKAGFAFTPAKKG